jgi:hypothetical protein
MNPSYLDDLAKNAESEVGHGGAYLSSQLLRRQRWEALDQSWPGGGGG